MSSPFMGHRMMLRPRKSTASQANASSPFLKLPRELRDIIYLYLLDDEHREPPEDPEAAGKRKKKGKIYYETTFPLASLLLLKRVCQTTHAEVTDILSRHPVDPDEPAHLDVIFRDPYFWPTWTFIPQTPTFPKNVHISIHIAFSGPCLVSEAPIQPGLTALLTQLIGCGPRFCRPLSEPLHFDMVSFSGTHNTGWHEVEDGDEDGDEDERWDYDPCFTYQGEEYDKDHGEGEFVGSHLLEELRNMADVHCWAGKVDKLRAWLNGHMFTWDVSEGSDEHYDSIYCAEEAYLPEPLAYGGGPEAHYERGEGLTFGEQD